ncbi:MAG: hypothetical protein QOF61_392 [Acidobacteriota bacterium]|nr:hypothetical protein [Acidobacteriota bacterium]
MTRLTKRLFLLFAILSLVAPFTPLPHRASAETHLDTTEDAAQRPINWTISGPMGGDARDLAMDSNDPHHLLMGTIDGQIYETTDGAKTWSRLPSFNHPGRYVDNIIIDPRDSKVIYVALHKHKEPGGFFKSTDGGQTWKESQELKTEALHSLTQSISNPDILVAGSNTGIYLTKDAGETWELLPTSAYPDIRNIESLAVDPRNNDHIYLGTWHLPWKTVDGGKTWKSIKTGMIDDSDVFAITIDQRNPDHVIASACSGIYESKNAGDLWRKVQGIPSQSRRTRDIIQHPSQPNVIFAGTTEGFWRSANGGDSWMLTTSRQLEINSIAVHPKEPNTIYIGTNNYGVMISRDGGKNFLPSNEGYSGRRAYFILPDREKSGRVYAATINTATGGGFFFVSNDGGTTWQPSMRNMPNRLIAYSILQDQTNADTVYLGTNLGVYRSLDRGASWSPIGSPEENATPVKKKPARRSARSRRAATSRGAATSARDDASSARAASSSSRVASSSPRAALPVPTGRARRPAPAQREPRPAPAASAASAASQADDKKMMMRAQVVLGGLGYSIGEPDGVAGTRTVAALRRFQADKDLPQTGRLDDATLNALGLGGGKQTVEEAKGVQTAPMGLTETINALGYFYEPGGQFKLLAATNKGLYKTVASDPAKGWLKVPFGAGFDERALCFSTHPQNPQTIYVGTANSGVLVSRDAGQTWQQVADVSAAAPVNVIEQDPQRPGYIYVGTTQMLFMSHDGGEKWERRGGNLPYGSFTSILINAQNPDEIFVGSAFENPENNGVFHSTDAGVTWKRVDPDLPSRRVWALAFDTNNPGRLFVGSHSAGVYVAQRDLSATATAVAK